MRPKDKDKGGTSIPPNEMTENLDWLKKLLAAITKIKSHKQRPNLERITQTMRHLYSSAPDDVFCNLQHHVCIFLIFIYYYYLCINFI